MISTSGGIQADAFDALITRRAPDDADSTAPSDGLAGLSSFGTVVVAFLSIALAQIAVALITPTIFDLPGTRAVLVGLVVAPAVLYAVVAAWDHRELVSSGQVDAPTWLWAVLPPVYLLLRRRRIATTAGRMRTALGWSLAQAVVTVAFAVFAVAAVVTAPAASADAASVVSTPTTAEQLEDAVEQGWAESGAVGTAWCSGPAELRPDTEVACTGTYDGVPLRFTASVGDAGEPAVTIASWAEIPAA